MHIAQLAVIFPILFIPLQVHPYSLFQTVLPMLIYSYPYVSISASIVFFPVPPDFSFQQECSPDGLSDCTQPSGLEHGQGYIQGVPGPSLGSAEGEGTHKPSMLPFKEGMQ